MATTLAELQIDEYLRERLMPVEGAIPHLPGIEMYGDSIPASTVGGDLFEYINFAQRYDIDTRISKALKASADFLRPIQTGTDCSDECVRWLRARPDYRVELEAAYRKIQSLERVRVAENLAGLYDTAGVLLVDAQGHGLISAKIASTVHDTFHAFMLCELDRYGTTTAEVFEDINLRLAHSVTARNTLGRIGDGAAREIATMLYGEVHPSGHFRFINFGHPPPLLFSAGARRFDDIDQNRMVQFLPLGLEVFGYLESDRFTRFADVPGGYVWSMTEDIDGNLWISHQDLGLIRVSPGNEVTKLPWAKLGFREAASTLAADPVRGGLWLGFRQSGLAYWKDGQPLESFTAARGLGSGYVGGVQLDRDGTLWAATEGGLSRLRNGRLTTLTRKNGLPCDAVHWAMEDGDRSLWLDMPCGLVRIPRADLDAWFADPNRVVKPAVFDSSEGVWTRTLPGHDPPVARSDGKLWFATMEGVSVIDPHHISINKLPPPVHIEQVVADRQSYDLSNTVHLPPLVRDLTINYTALSLVAPEKNRFRYKLEGHDRDWQEAGDRRQAFYNDLPPRNYRFRVIACNNSGVWNEAGASLDFSIAPAYYQTGWFLTLCLASFLILLAALYQLRLRQITQHFDIRMEERLNERTRIARDLHDTLLQSFQGLLLKFHSASYHLPDRPAEAQKTLDSAIEQARAAITEGRAAIQGLRGSAVTNDLVGAITIIGEELATSPSNLNSQPEFRVEVEGSPRELSPLLQDEVYRIAGEAMRNAFRHAVAKRIEVEIHYDERQFRLRIRDDGKGIDSAVLKQGGRAGHFGLAGMQERAKLVGGKLSVWSELHSGTETELIIPASIAYAKSDDSNAITNQTKA